MKTLGVVVETKWVPHKGEIGEDLIVTIRAKNDNRIIKEGTLSLSFRRNEASYQGIKEFSDLEKVVKDIIKESAKRDNNEINLKFL